jgi:adenosylcobyric acid synthase
LAQHYDVAIVPARPAKPRDKAEVESGVLLAQRWILACLTDRQGIDERERGLELLPLDTVFHRDKLLRPARTRFGSLANVWAALSDVTFEGYEIREGRTAPRADADLVVALRNKVGEPIGWQRGGVLGIYAHGIFESPAVMRALFDVVPRTLNDVFDGLADFVEAHFEVGALGRLIGE